LNVESTDIYPFTNSGKMTNYSLLTACARLLEHRWLRLGLLKSIFKAENVERWFF